MATSQLPLYLEQRWRGELSLDGELREVPGTLAMALSQSLWEKFGRELILHEMLWTSLVGGIL